MPHLSSTDEQQKKEYAAWKRANKHHGAGYYSASSLTMPCYHSETEMDGPTKNLESKLNKITMQITL